MSAPDPTEADGLELLELLFCQDGLYEPDPALGARELPPRPWRVSEQVVEEVLREARAQLDAAWRQVREQARRDRVAAAMEGRFERRSDPALARRGAVSGLIDRERRGDGAFGGGRVTARGAGE